MKKARIVLSFLLFAFAALAFALPWSRFGGWLWPAVGLLSVLSLSASTILAFTFFRVTETYEGDYCFDPENAFWRFMEQLYESNWGSCVSLCKAFWLTAFVLALCALYIFTVGALIYLFYVSPKALWLLPVSALSIGTLVVVQKAATKYLWISKAAAALLLFGVLAFYGFAGYKAVVALMVKYHCSALLAALILLGYILAFSATIAAMFGIVTLAFYIVPQLKETQLGRIVKAFKQKTCPVLYVCNRQNDYMSDEDMDAAHDALDEVFG
jgi:hypothetical protein